EPWKEIHYILPQPRLTLIAKGLFPAQVACDPFRQGFHSLLSRSVNAPAGASGLPCCRYDA
ncbi:MAG: hypothetical protein K2H38_06795, partial [Muribaculaceae bacterium]|nr:hypothetical protein [Muribaculaceae bacterium]